MRWRRSRRKRKVPVVTLDHFLNETPAGDVVQIAPPRRCEECQAPWVGLVNGQCSRCGNRTWETTK